MAAASTNAVLAAHSGRFSEVEVLRQLVTNWQNEAMPDVATAAVLKGPIFSKDYSRLYRVDFANGRKAALKVCLSKKEIAHNFAQRQFLETRAISECVNTNSCFRVPEALELFPSYGAILMEWMDAVSLRQILKARRMNASERIAAVARAGQWLRHFHNSGPSKTVCLEDEHLANELDFARNFAGKHGAGSKAVSASFDRLEAAIPRLRGVKAEQSWLHGDFQPANVMMADDRTYGFDFAFSRTGFALADAAHMFNDIERAATGPKGLHLRPHRKKMLAAFVRGYLNAAGEDDLRALAWFRSLDNICFLARHYPYIRMSAHRWYFAVMQAALINASLGEIAGQINFF